MFPTAISASKGMQSLKEEPTACSSGYILPMSEASLTADPCMSQGQGLAKSLLNLKLKISLMNISSSQCLTLQRLPATLMHTSLACLLWKGLSGTGLSEGHLSREASARIKLQANIQSSRRYFAEKRSFLWMTP